MSSAFFDSEVTDEERRTRLYAGDIFIFSPTDGTRALINLARKMLEEAFSPYDPRTIHERETPEEVATILGRLKPNFIHHPDCKRLIPQIMREQGVDPERLYFDVPRMRSAYPSHFLSSGIAYAFHPHRDTWYSAPMCQLNWWLPIYPIEPDNSLGFYPRYFGEVVENNSEISTTMNGTRSTARRRHSTSGAIHASSPRHSKNSSQSPCVSFPRLAESFCSQAVNCTRPCPT
jgi:hypothetical protein